MPELSVVIPTKNEEASIGICIEKIQRVFTEHHIDGEIIIADNSTDITPEIAKSLGALEFKFRAQCGHIFASSPYSLSQ